MGVSFRLEVAGDRSLSPVRELSLSEALPHSEHGSTQSRCRRESLASEGYFVNEGPRTSQTCSCQSSAAAWRETRANDNSTGKEKKNREMRWMSRDEAVAVCFQQCEGQRTKVSGLIRLSAEAGGAR